MVAFKPTANLPERKTHAPFLFRHPRRQTLEQLLTARACVLPYPIGPAPVHTRDGVKVPVRFRLPVIGQKGRMPEPARRVLGEPLTKEEVDAILAESPRPTTRAQCENGIRPCPFVSCRHHLMLDVHATSGALHINFSDLASMKETCSLDVVDRGKSLTLTELGDLVGCSNERVRQITLDAAPAFEGFGWPKLR